MLRSLTLAGAMLAAAAPAAAQSANDMVEGLSAMVRDKLGHKEPIVPTSLDRQTVQRGALTAQIQACGGRWSKVSYLPFMAQLRASGRYSEEQLAYVGVLHGFTQQTVFQSLSARSDPCPAGVRTALAAALAR